MNKQYRGKIIAVIMSAIMIFLNTMIVSSAVEVSTILYLLTHNQWLLVTIIFHTITSIQAVTPLYFNNFGRIVFEDTR